MSKEETPGTSSSYYSTSTSSNSNSSSVENISSGTSTIENGDLCVFTFLMSKVISPDLSYLPDKFMHPASNSCIHVPNCGCACKINKFRGGISQRPHHCPTPSSLDIYGVTPQLCRSMHNHLSHGGKEHCGCVCHCDSTYGNRKLCQNSLSSSYTNMISQSNLDGYLIRSLEKGVLYPVIHWSSKSNENLAHQFTFRDVGDRRSNVVFYQGVYKELKRVIPSDAWIHKFDSTENPTNPPNKKRPTWLILGYKSLEKTLDPVLEATWKEWTGTRHIYLNLRHDFDIQKISFFNRVQPQDNLDLFMYLVLMEIGNVDDRNVMWLLDFVQRTRVERMKGFLTVYTEVEVENEFSTINDEYLKYFADVTNKVNSSCDKSSANDLPEVVVGGNGNHELLSGKKFIEKLLQEIQDTSLADYC